MPRFNLPIEYPFAAEAAAALGYAGRKLGKALDALAAGSSTTFRMTSGRPSDRSSSPPDARNLDRPNRVVNLA